MCAGRHAMTKKNSLTKVVERLKSLAEAEGRESFDAGQRAGESWACETASPRQLRRLDKQVEDSGGASSYVEQDRNAHQTAAQRIAEEIDGEDNSFWEIVLGDNHENQTADANFLQGFLTGVLTIWSAVENQL